MPPKRRSSGTGAPASRAKTAKTAKTADAPAAAAGGKAKKTNKRWSAVSGSSNADASYKMRNSDPAVAYKYICICKPFPGFEAFGEDDDNDDDDDWQDEEIIEGDVGPDGDSWGEEFAEGADGPSAQEEKEKKSQRCGSGKCLCNKPAAEHPEHVWSITRAGKEKFVTQLLLADLRNPDNFGMDTYNDHYSYGILETVENLMLDFVEAGDAQGEDAWKEQWVCCEAMVLSLGHPRMSRLLMIDDGEGLDRTIQLVGRMFLSMLARLEQKGLLTDGSEVRDLGLIMALYIYTASTFRDNGGLLEDEVEGEPAASPAAPDPSTFAYPPHRFDDYVLVYADKYGVTLPGRIEDIVSELDGDVGLPEAPAAAGADTWGWKKAFQAHKRAAGKMGGDKYDLTTWTSAERKSSSYDGKDPLGRAEIKALKEGKVMQIG